ncbi:MAG: methyltransferase [Desulfobacterales bacterium]|nr:MAG: methyltransferase [Desulfobacterales bacterium]
MSGKDEDSLKVIAVFQQELLEENDCPLLKPMKKEHKMRKELPNPELNPEDFFMLQYEAFTWEILKTAIELNLFDLTTEPVTPGTISDKLCLHADNTKHILNALVALDYLKKEKERYKNTSQTEHFLTSGKDTSIGEALLFMWSWTMPLLNGGLKEIVTNGPPPPQDITNPEIWEKSARMSVNYSLCGWAQSIARYVSMLPEFSSFKTMLDLGAGPGIIGLAVTAVHPSLRCVVFDQPAVAKVASEIVAEYGMDERVVVQGGDYMQDDFGMDYDFVMANFTLNFCRNNLGDIMGKVRNALKPGGVFMVTSDGLNHDRTSPAASVISWLPTTLQGYDMSFETGQISRAMLDAGFVSTEMKTITNIQAKAHGPVEMTIGRKGK